jgi:hypothetical protein
MGDCLAGKHTHALGHNISISTRPNLFALTIMQIFENKKLILEKYFCFGFCHVFQFPKKELQMNIFITPVWIEKFL